MKHVKRSVLLWYSPLEMYALVTAVEQYPAFLPWCERAELVQHHDDGVTARLWLSYMGVKQSFTTRNVHVPDASVAMALVDGPFSLLEGAWQFTPIGAGAPGSEAPPDAAAQRSACRIAFELRYAFKSGALESVVSPVFDRIADTFVDSFVRRAEQVYGVR